MKTPTQRSYSILIIIRGIPGSGKSYLAQKLINLIEEPVITLDPDTTDYESTQYIEHVKQQTVEGVDPKLHAYRFLRAQAQKGIENRNIIIWNQPFTNLEIFHKMMNTLRSHASKHNTDFTLLVVEVEVDSQVAKKRIDARKSAGGHGPSENTFDRFVGDYKSYASEGFNTVTVNGSDDPEVSTAKIMEALKKL